MKNKRNQKLLTSASTILACALLIGATITLPTPTDEDGNPVIELPSSEDEEPEYSPLGDEEPFSGDDE